MVLRRTVSSSTIISRYYSTRTTTKTNNLTTKVQNALKKQIQPPPPPPPQRKSHIRFLSTTNNNINNPNPKSPQEWAKENPQKARQILSVPPLLSSPFPKTTTQLETLNDYLSYRKWILPEDDEDDEEREMAIKLLSHPLTYPLTLASQIHHFLPQKDKKGKDDNDDEDEEEEEKERTIKLCCIGARAEATLPLDYWRESLILASALSTNYIPKKNKNNSKKTNKQQHTYKWEITFVGPQIPLQQNTFHKNGKTNAAAAASQVVVTTLPPPPPTKHQNPNHPIIHHSNLSMTYYCTTINQYIQSYYIQNPTFVKNDSLLSTTTDYDYYPSPFDGFVLFNPGLGHENLKHEWKDAIEYVVRTGRTVLLSAHSDLDARRDLEVLRELFLLLEEKNGEKRVLGGGGYDVNPFASLLEYDDPYATTTTTTTAAADTMGEKEGHVVRPNHSVMIIPRADVK